MKFTTLALSATLVASAFASQAAEPRAFGRRGDSDAPQWIKRSVQNMKRQGVVPNGALLLTVGANATAADNGTAAALEISSEVEIPTYNGTALWYRANNETGACREVSTDEDLIIGIPSAFWPFAGVVSDLCGEKVVLYAGEKNVTATLLDASGGEYVSLSVGAFLALSPLTAGMISVQYQFLNLTLGASLNASLNATILQSTPLLASNATLADPYLSLQADVSADDTPIAAVSAALSVALPSVTLPTPTVAPTASSVEAEPTTSSDNGASASRASAQSASSASSAAAAQAAASQAAVEQAKAQAQQATEQAAHKVKDDAAQAAQKARDDAEWAASQAASSSSAAAAAASSSAAASAQDVKDAAASAASAAAAVVTPIVEAASNVFTGGKGTYFYQNGVAGNCGKVHSESFKGIAIDHVRYGSGENCWRMIEVTRTDTGAKVVAQVVDNCPTCHNSESLDLSEGAFLEIATKEEGMVDISWKFLD